MIERTHTIALAIESLRKELKLQLNRLDKLEATAIKFLGHARRPKNCIECGKPLPKPNKHGRYPRGKIRLFCNGNCRQIEYNRRKRQKDK